MPIYVYKCTVCEHEFELLRQYEKRELPAECPECGQDAGYRLSASNWKRGSGWAARMDGASMPGRQ